MLDTETVTLSVFGAGKYRSRVQGSRTTAGDVLREHGVKPGAHRLARNGHTTTSEALVVEGDELTLVPRVQGG
jgi:hypothetical protein